MKLEKKRYISAWILLAVFLPMLVLSSLHIHQESETLQDTCTECVHHHCHGHLSQLADAMHQCVLCQFLTLTFVAGVTSAFLFLSPACRTHYARLVSAHCSDSCGIIVTRGPPAIL
jgi:hypothetical protein